MKMLRSFLYNFFLCFLALYLLVRKKKGRSLFEKEPSLPRGKPVIWIHAVSVGETKAVAPLAHALKKKRPDAAFLITSITKTGHEEAKRTLTFADAHLYLPFDLPWIIGPFVWKIKPELVLISETDLWPNFLSSAKKCGAKIALVNGKLSEKTARRLQKFPGFAKDHLGQIDLFCLQSPIYGKRFESLGIPNFHITGNLKGDGEQKKLSKEEIERWKKELGLENAKIVVVGSSHEPEEQLFLPAFQNLWKRFPTLKVLFVPRHPERFDEVFHLLQKAKIPTLRYSQKETLKGDERAILIDQMGILPICYQFADVALVAGSFTEKVGGHNILEPAVYGVPVLFGPHMHAQPDLVERVKTYQAGLQITLSELESALMTFLEEGGVAMGKRGQRLVTEMGGGTAKTLEHILSPLQRN